MGKFIVIAGPCVVENLEICLEVATRVKRICHKAGFHYIFKSSYKKANRTRLKSFSGLDEEEAFSILRQVKEKAKVPVLTDIHETTDVDKVKDFADFLQIPAFLCRQTELLLAAGSSGKWVNIKKGQFASPESMAFAVEKVRSTGNKKVMLTERGTTFGYYDLVVDFRSVPRMQKFGVPVIVDCTHSLQQPNQQSGISGGTPEMIETLCRAAVAVGADGLFIETHPNPQAALSDASSMLPLDKISYILRKCEKIRQAMG
ncbi:MAG: 2-dehydro-3-deoxyphosphooctonate aldolase [Chitinophagales bacterium]|nr:MAG: 2-dehydro-3-deoxyphosphooctonate aldolase [Chitinophagales bacterium]